MKHILALDEGTTSARAIVFDAQGRVVSLAQKEFTQHFPHSGWVEHDALEIWAAQLGVAVEKIRRVHQKVGDVVFGDRCDRVVHLCISISPVNTVVAGPVIHTG